MPHPLIGKSGRLFFKLEGGAARVTWKVYSPSAVLEVEQKFEGPFDTAWSNVAIDISTFPAGVHYSVIEASRGTERSKGSKRAFFVVR
jgi:hypothetical protein